MYAIVGRCNFVSQVSYFILFFSYDSINQRAGGKMNTWVFPELTGSFLDRPGQVYASDSSQGHYLPSKYQTFTIWMLYWWFVVIGIIYFQIPETRSHQVLQQHWQARHAECSRWRRSSASISAVSEHDEVPASDLCRLRREWWRQL